jgi:hypothetical protein
MTKLEKAIQELLLENTDMIKDVVRELNSWNGCLDNLDVYENDEEFFDTFFEGKPMEAVRAAQYGDYAYNNDYVRFNGYGNLESLSEYDYEQELKDNLTDIIELLIEHKDNLYLCSELEELFEDENE